MAGRTMAEIWVAVRPDVSKTGPELTKKLGSVDTSKAGKKAGDSYAGGFGSSIKKIAGLAAGVVAGVKVKNFLVESTKGYRDHAKVAAVTTQVIKTTGAAAKVSATQVGALSDAIELKTGVDGDAIQSGANLLLTFTNVRNETGKGNQVFTRATGLLADMSVALGQDAKGSAIQLGKALNDPITGVTALSKVGVSFTENQKKQIKTLVESGNTLKAQKIILNELGKEFGGAAAAAADPADRATVAYHQLQDEIGSGALPVVNALATSFADLLAPALIDIATKHGPAVTAFLSGLAPKISASLGLLITGDFNGKIGKALGGLTEDSPYVGGILSIRQGLLGVKDTLTVLATGNFTERIFGQTEDSKYVDVLFRIRDVLKNVYASFVLLATGNFSAKIFGQGEDSQFVGVLFKVRDGIIQIANSIKTADTTQLKAQFVSLVDSAGKLLPVVGEFIQQMPSLRDVVGGAVGALAFLADHTETLRKILPFLVAGVIAYKAAQAAANVASLLSVPTKVAEVLVNRQLVKSNRELIASRAGLALTTGAETVATEANTVAKSTGILTTLRMRAAAIAQGIAQKAVALGTAVWTGAQWLLNAALTANPIGLIIVGIGLLIAAVVFIATKTSWFQTIWKVAWGAIQKAAAVAFNWVKANWPLILAILTGPIGVAVLVISKHWEAIKSAAQAALRFVVLKVFDFAQNILDGAAKAFGWVPGLGDKLKGAKTAFGKFRDSVNASLGGINDKEIGVTPNIKNVTFQGHTVPLNQIGSFGRLATGGKADGFKVSGPGTTTNDRAGLFALSKKEWVINARASMRQGDERMRMLNAGRASIVPDAAAATGGKAGVLVKAQLPSPRGLGLWQREVAAHTVNAARPAMLTVANATAQNMLNQAYAGGGDAGPPGSRRSFRGVTLNDRTIRMLLKAEQILGAVFHITQGSYSTRVAASGGTHSGGGAMDTNGPRGWNVAVRALRAAGFASWHRTPSQGPWRDHIHSIAIGDPTASPSAKAQVASFKRGGDGLGALGMAKGGRIGSYADGAWKILTDQLAAVHKDEMVVPAKSANPLRKLLPTLRLRGKLHQLHGAHLAHLAHVTHLNHLNNSDVGRFISHSRRAITADTGAPRLHPDDIQDIGVAVAGAIAVNPPQVLLDGRRVDQGLSRRALGGGY